MQTNVKQLFICFYFILIKSNLKRPLYIYLCLHLSLSYQQTPFIFKSHICLSFLVFYLEKFLFINISASLLQFPHSFSFKRREPPTTLLFASSPLPFILANASHFHASKCLSLSNKQTPLIFSCQNYLVFYDFLKSSPWRYLCLSL